MNKIKIGVGIMLILGITLTSYGQKKETSTGKSSADVTASQKNIPPKPLKVYTKDGVSVKAYDFDKLEYFLKQKNDTTYVVNFWATWCIPCVEELPHFEKLNEKYKGDKVKVMLVSLDMSKMVESRLLPFIKNKQLKSDVVYLQDPDQNTWLPKVDPAWSGAIPATIIYNKDKRKFYKQSFTYDELEKEVSNFK